MDLTARRCDLHLKHSFTISRSSREVVPTVIVGIGDAGLIGWGEASPSARYGETVDSVTDFLTGIGFSRFGEAFRLEDILGAVGAYRPGNTAAKAAVDIALHDLLGKKIGLPLWKLWGLNRDNTPVTSLTIGIDRPEIVVQKVREAEDFPILKVKAGGPNDREMIGAIRGITPKPLRVDANEGWKSREEALEMILWLEEQGAELVEQPMPDACLDDIAWLRERVHVPLIADESVKTLSDIPRIRGAFDGINIKLMKCTGLREALRMIHAARAMEMKVMLGCMIESSIGISAAAQLSPLADYADLDGNVLISDDPFTGVGIEGGKLVLSDLPGIGVKPNTRL